MEEKAKVKLSSTVILDRVKTLKYNEEGTCTNLKQGPIYYERTSMVVEGTTDYTTVYYEMDGEGEWGQVFNSIRGYGDTLIEAVTDCFINISRKMEHYGHIR